MKSEHQSNNMTRDCETYRKRLQAELKTFQDRVNRARQELLLDFEPDDDAGVAARSAYREATMGNLERDLQTIIEIERALSRLDDGEYATCVACRSRIPVARLKAIPWTRTCVECAGRRTTFGTFRLNPTLAH